MLSYKEYLQEMVIDVYHGSPKNFERFKKEHISTGTYTRKHFLYHEQKCCLCGLTVHVKNVSQK